MPTDKRKPMARVRWSALLGGGEPTPQQILELLDSDCEYKITKAPLDKWGKRVITARIPGVGECAAYTASRAIAGIFRDYHQSHDK